MSALYYRSHYTERKTWFKPWAHVLLVQFLLLRTLACSKPMLIQFLDFWYLAQPLCWFSFSNFDDYFHCSIVLLFWPWMTCFTDLLIQFSRLLINCPKIYWFNFFTKSLINQQAQAQGMVSKVRQGIFVIPTPVVVETWEESTLTSLPLQKREDNLRSTEHFYHPYTNSNWEEALLATSFRLFLFDNLIVIIVGMGDSNLFLLKKWNKKEMPLTYKAFGHSQTRTWV